MKKFLHLSIFLLLVVDGFSQKTFEHKKLISDFDFAVQELKLQHQGFYNYMIQRKLM